MTIFVSYAFWRLRLWAAAAIMITPTQSLAQPSDSSPPGVFRVQPKSYAYKPRNSQNPASLIVLLHGASGDARSFIEEFRREADARRIVLLSVQSAGRTWAVRKPREDDQDVIDIKAAIEGLAATTPIDMERVTVMGFSDGASYALSVGMAYPNLFRTVVAFSPGYAFAPQRLDTDQRIFIAHSRRDPILPADNTRQIVKELQRAGLSPDVHWFNGGHEIDPQMKQAGIDFALRP